MLASWTRTRIALSSLTAAVALSACAHREPLYPVRGDAGALPPPAYVPPPPPPPPPPPRNPEIPEARPTTPVETKSLPPVGAAASVRMRMADTGVFQPTPAQPWPK